MCYVCCFRVMNNDFMSMILCSKTQMFVKNKSSVFVHTVILHRMMKLEPVLINCKEMQNKFNSDYYNTELKTVETRPDMMFFSSIYCYSIQNENNFLLTVIKDDILQCKCLKTSQLKKSC